MTRISPKLQPGSSVWHRPSTTHPTGYETRRSPDSNPPSGTDWERGFRPLTENEREEKRKRCSEMFMGRVMTPEWRAKMSAASKGKKKSPEHIAAMSAASKEFHRKRKENK